MLSQCKFLTIFTLILSLSFLALSNADILAKASSKDKAPETRKSQSVSKKSVSKESARKVKSSAGATQNDSKKNVSSKAVKDSDKELWLERASKSNIFTGKASWYGKDFHAKKTASGVSYDMYTFTAAHRTLPMGTVVKVTDQDNGKSVMVCVTDRGPYVQGRIIDLSFAAAQQLDLGTRGVGRVKLEVVSDEKGLPLKNDRAYFVEYPSGNGKKSIGPFKAFSDAAAMHEAVRQAHPDAHVVLGTPAK